MTGAWCCNRLLAEITWTLKVAPLVEDNLHLFFNGLGAQQVVECFAARHAVSIVVRATVSAGHQMFNGDFGFRQGLAAEETLAPLGKQ